MAKLEDVLHVYARPPDPARPLVCFDESGKECGATCGRRSPRLPATRRGRKPSTGGRAAPTSSSGWRPISGDGR